MEILYILIPLSLVLVAMIMVVFWMALKGGQFDDLEGPAWRILMDDEEVDTAPAQPAAAPRNAEESRVNPPRV